MSETFNHIFSLQHVYQVQYVMLHTCTRIDKTCKNIDCKNCSFTSNLHFFGGGGHLNLTVAKKHSFFTPRNVFKRKKTLILFNMFFGVTRFYSLDNISIGTPPSTTSASFHP